MTSVYVSTVIPVPTASVWQVVRDFNGLPGWAPFIAESRIEQGARADQVGCIRNLRLQDGGLIRERLLALSDYDMSFSYTILESPLAVENYLATLSLTPITDGNATFAEWKADFDCPPERETELAAHVGGNVFQSAFSALRRQLGGR